MGQALEKGKRREMGRQSGREFTCGGEAVSTQALGLGGEGWRGLEWQVTGEAADGVLSWA